MRYAMLIYTQETSPEDISEEEANTFRDAYFEFTNDVRQKGIVSAGEALQPTSTATSVRVRAGETVSSDGPFAETKEQLGGFYILDCKDLDEAIEYAARIPGAWVGTIEVRPIQDFPEA
jgi:hypothetical protein